MSRFASSLRSLPMCAFYTLRLACAQASRTFRITVPRGLRLRCRVGPAVTSQIRTCAIDASYVVDHKMRYVAPGFM